MSASSVKIYINMAREYLDSPYRIDDVEPNLAQAEQRLSNLSLDDAAPLRDEITEIRTALDNVVKPSDARQISAAQGKIRQALDHISTNRGSVSQSDKDFIEELFKIAIQHLDNITDERKADKLKAPVLAEMDRIRTQYGTNASAAPPPQPVYYPPPQPAYSQASRSHPQTYHPPPPSSTQLNLPALSPIDADLLARANRSLTFARSNIDDERRHDSVEPLLFEASSILAGMSECPAKTNALAEIASLRGSLARVINAEAARQITSELDRRLGDLEGDVGMDRWVYSLRSWEDRFARGNVRQVLDAEVVKGYEGRFGDVKKRHEGALKGGVMAKAEEAMRELREKLERNPFDGLKGYDVNRMDGEVKGLRYKAEREVNSLPEGDEDRVRMKEEVEALMKKFEGYSNAWGKQELYEDVRREWESTKDQAVGWEDEAFDPDSGMPLDEPQLPRTRTAIMRVKYYLKEDRFVQRTRDENVGDEFISGVDKEAEELLEAAGRKMANAYGIVVEQAERMELAVEDHYLRSKPLHLVVAAETTFEGTKFCGEVVGRIKALNQRWEDEVTAAKEGRENLGKRLTEEGRQKWPTLIASIRTVENFDPLSAEPGDAVHLRNVYNRAGWDFGGEYGFSMRYNGVPLGGFYEDHIGKALDYAAYHQKLKIDDHEAWDLVGVVVGPGSIKERTSRTIRIGTHTEDIEEWIPINCVRMRIIALRAGPVAVGPQS